MRTDARTTRPGRRAGRGAWCSQAARRAATLGRRETNDNHKASHREVGRVGGGGGIAYKALNNMELHIKHTK